MAHSPIDDEQRIALVSEDAEIETRERVTDRARLSIRTDEVTEDISTELESEDVEIVHVPRGEFIAAGSEPPRIREEDGVTVIPVLEEVAVVEKRLRLKEEIHIIRRHRSETAVTPVTLRQQRAVLERLDADGDDAPPSSATSKTE